MGTLYIVSTPIGNLKDITLRAIEILGNVDIVACEDTRVTGRLLTHLNISKKMLAVSDFNEEKMVSEIITILNAGKDIALVCDAGTPLISDPGFKIVREAVSRNIRVESIPGASASIAALSISGLATDKFMFIGYLSKKDLKRESQIKDIKKIAETVKTTFILYESPYRVVKTLDSIKNVFGDINIVVCRELTKLHEEIYRGKISEFKMNLKGEFVILF